jgi:hypothetical protein
VTFVAKSWERTIRLFDFASASRGTHPEKQPGRYREELRAPVGVRKAPRNEPASRKAVVYGYFGFRLGLLASGPVVGDARRGAIRSSSLSDRVTLPVASSGERELQGVDDEACHKPQHWRQRGC